MDEAALLTLLKQGNKAAFHNLIAAYQKNVINICYRFLLNLEDAEDVAQEVFIEIFQSIKHFRGEAKLSTWIYRIAATKSLDEIKKQNRKKRITAIAKSIGLEQITHWISSHERPDKVLEENESYRILLNALNKLPENQRIAITLSKMEDYNNAEIAEIMNTTVTAVESLIYRAKINFLHIIKR
ncbi:MAG: RNA polymerase sigma factor [Bacteroidetes bacterium]|nr:RNA polymerase sigma factor [Bacteroidota bacterium]